MKDIEKKLTAPFNESDIQWRIQQAGISQNQNPWAIVIPYVDNRAIQKRLDEVFGVMGWENCYKPTPDGKGYLCGLTIHVGERSITKWDGAEYTNVEPLKGALSDSMKRCAVQLGIGRYLYQLEATFADCHLVENRKDAVNVHIHYPNKQNRSIKHLIAWAPPILPAWAQPVKDYSEFISAIKSAETIEELKAAYKTAYRASESNQDDQLLDQATAAKDKRKAEIVANAASYLAERVQHVLEWLSDEMAVFLQLPSVITVINYYEKVLAMLKNEIADMPEWEKAKLILDLEDKAYARCNELGSDATRDELFPKNKALK